MVGDGYRAMVGSVSNNAEIRSFISTLLFLSFNTIGYVVCELLQIRGCQIDSVMHLY